MPSAAEWSNHDPMNTRSVYSLAVERLAAERQQSIIRLFLAITSSLVLFKFYRDQLPPASDEPLRITIQQVELVVALLMGYSVAMCVLVWWIPGWIRTTMAVSSFLEVALITYIIRTTAATEIPFHLWYIFYVVSVATRYGWQYSVLALSASIVSFILVACFAPLPYGTNVTAVLGFTAFLLVLAFMFGRMSERQLRYQSSLAVVDELRAELAGLATTCEIIDHILSRTRGLLNAEMVFFLPATREADDSDGSGLRSAGAEPVVVAAFREDAGVWNVDEIIREQRPRFSNRIGRDATFPHDVAIKLELRNLAAAPMMVRATPVGVIYVANRKDRPLSDADLQLLELIATQAAPVIENALLWERLREAAASEERLRIARDLHDNFLQTLAAIKLHLERCKILISKDSSDRAIEGVDRIHQIATRGLAEVRAYLSELRLMGPEPSRLRQVIERTASDAAARGGFDTDINIDLPEDPIPPGVALAGFQIARELLNNAATHAKAKHVRVNVNVADGSLVLEVSDDGVGFDVSRIRSQKASEGHLGLVGVEERARQSGGSFAITSEPGKGTRAVATLALK
ncbi:MAG: GAF domain-containing sensor histidine kinase [Armatimonadetes bacterium]|nr:GAF domain-containing sensor histidine kinase [Armatimonadota bacterium]